MRLPNQFLAGTALCLLMAAPSAQAGSAVGTSGLPAQMESRLLLAQADQDEGEGAAECPPGTASAPDGECAPVEPPQAPEEQAPAEEQPNAEPPADVEPTAEEAPAEAQPDADVPAEAAPAAEEAPAVDEAPAVEEPATEEPPVDEAPATEEAPAPEEAAPAGEAPPSDEPAEEEPTAEEASPGEPADEAPEADQAPAGEETPSADEPVEETPAIEQPASEATPAEDPDAVEQTPTDEAPADDQAPVTEEAPEAEQATDPDASADEAPAGQEESDSETVMPEAGTEDPAAPEAAESPEDESATETEEVLPEDAAPVLDSQKEGAGDGEQPPAAGEEQPAEGTAAPDDQPSEQQESEAQAVPETDEQAQRLIDPEQLQTEIRNIVEEEGQRIDVGRSDEGRRETRRELFREREDARIVREYDDNRTIVEINNNFYVESRDYDRIVRSGDEIYYEELRGGRVREVVERHNGVRIITIRNRFGDVVRRVRVMPDGREYVLVYVPDNRFDEVRRFEDAGRGLPPLRLTIPVSEYILEADSVQDSDRYYTFLEQPPVEPVRRLYSIDEVKYSARVRDIVRRIDLDTIEFEFGSARIEESEINDLEAVADAMLRMLDENPGETFLIEGHTDAVGSETANLALSDRRAEAVARALTDVFDVPPENLATQGYGEQYLKVNTQEPSRENRRVAIRRITPLVAPVARAQ